MNDKEISRAEVWSLMDRSYTNSMRDPSLFNLSKAYADLYKALNVFDAFLAREESNKKELKEVIINKPKTEILEKSKWICYDAKPNDYYSFNDIIEINHDLGDDSYSYNNITYPSEDKTIITRYMLLKNFAEYKG